MLMVCDDPSQALWLDTLVYGSNSKKQMHF